MNKQSQGGLGRSSLIVLAFVLTVSVPSQGIRLAYDEQRARAAHLADSVPSRIPGWTGLEVPLGPSGFVSSEAGKAHNFDEVLIRELSSSASSFAVYVAYWGPERCPRA